MSFHLYTREPGLRIHQTLSLKAHFAKVYPTVSYLVRRSIDGIEKFSVQRALLNPMLCRLWDGREREQQNNDIADTQTIKAKHGRLLFNTYSRM